MILFLHDWQKFPTAVVHHQTTNKTFLRLAEIYKRMGVKNYAFHLALLQPELIGVDPHSPYLTQEQKAMISLECRYNPWYFFREVLRIPPQAGKDPVQFRANRGNIAMLWLFFNHIDVALIQPRQTGKSVSTDGLMLYLICVATVNTRVNMLTKDDQLRKANVDRLKKMRGFLPKYLDQMTDADSDNKEEITCLALGNRYTTGVGQNSESSANNLGRGLTSPIQHIDEPPFIPYVDVTIPASLASGGAARDEAKLNDAHYGTIFTTTAGKKDSRSGKYMYDMIHRGMTWSEVLYDSNDHRELLNIITMGCRKDEKGRVRKIIVNATFSHRQLGYTDEWLAEKMSDANSFGEAADRDFFNRWTSGGLSSPLSIALNELIRGSVQEVQYTQITRDYYTLRWYIPEYEIDEYLENNEVVLGMDTSEAIGRDAISMLLVNAKTLQVVMASDINEANLIRFSSFVADFMIKHSKIVLIPERRSTGQSLIDTLLMRLPAAGIDPFKRIYNLIVDEADQRKDEFKEIQVDTSRRSSAFYDRLKKNFGFTTSSSGRHSRGALYSDALQMAARMGGAHVHDKTLADQITGLMVKNGRIDHSDNEHDDLVIAWLLVVWFLTQSKNLAYYGITSPLVYAREYSGKGEYKEPDPYEQEEREEQNAIRQEMEELLDALRGCRDDMVAMKMEYRIKTLDSRLKEHYTETSSIDALIREANANRARAARESIQFRNRLTSYG